MNITAKKFISFVVFVIAASVTKSTFAVENHALLIGVSDYADERIIRKEAKKT